MANPNSFIVGSQAAQTNLVDARLNDICKRTDLNQTFILVALPPSNIANWFQIAPQIFPVSPEETFTSVLEFGASGSGFQTLGVINQGSFVLTLEDAGDFENGEVVQIEQAGPTCALSAPSGLTVTPTNGTGSTSYEYEIASIDANGGCSAASAPVSIANGVATLGLNAISQSFNHLNWSVVSGAVCYAVYGRTSGSLTLIGVTTELQYDDIGIVYTITSNVPGTPPASPTHGDLITEILSGAGTLNLTLAAAAGQSVVTAQTNHNDTAAINTTIASLNGAGGTVFFPAGTYNVYPPLVLPTGVIFRGVSATASGIRHVNGFAPAVFPSGEHIRICDLGFSGSRCLMISSDVGSASNFTVEDCIFSGGPALAVNNGALGIEINRCYFQGSGRTIEFFSGVADINNWLIKKCWFQSSGFQNFICAPIVGTGGQVAIRITDCNFEGPPPNATCVPFVLGGMTDFTFQDCLLADWTTAATSNPVILTAWANDTGLLGLQFLECNITTGNGDLIRVPTSSQAGRFLFNGGDYVASGKLINGTPLEIVFVNCNCPSNTPPDTAAPLVIVNTVFSGGTIQLLSTLMTPSSSSVQGVAGQIAADANYIYICTATDTWKRAALSSF